MDIEGIPVNDIPALKAQTQLQSNSLFVDASYFFVPICKSSGPLANVKVRQALSYATDRVSINKALIYGKGEPAWSIFPSTSSFYDKSLTNDYAYNLKKAKALLAQAGYPHGFSTTIIALPEAITDQLATVLQGEWKKIGVKLSIVQSSNYVTDLYTDHKAQLGLNPEGLPGIDKITTNYTPGDVGDIVQLQQPHPQQPHQADPGHLTEQPHSQGPLEEGPGLHHEECAFGLRRLPADRDRQRRRM